MPKFNVSLTVVRTIVESKSVDLEIEADDKDAAEEKAAVLAESSDYHNREDQNWDLEELSSEGQDFEVSGGEEDE